MANRKLEIRYIGDASQLKSVLRDIDQSHATLGQRAGRFAKELGQTAIFAGTAIVGIGAAALKASADFESAFAGVRKTVDTTEDGLKKIERGLRDMSLEMPTSAEGLARIAEMAGQLGIAADDVVDFTKTVAQMAETTNLTAENAAEAFGQLGNILNLTSDDFERLGSTIVDLGNKGASTEADIVEFTKRLAGTGRTVGLTAPQIAGLGAAMANAGINAEAGGTAMSRVLQKMALAASEGGSELAAFAEVADMSSKQFVEAFRDRPDVAIVAFIDGLSRMKKGGEDLFGVLKDVEITEARQIDTLTRLAGAQMSVGTTMIQAIAAWKANLALQTEYNERLKTFAAQLKIFRNRLFELLLAAGDLVRAFATPILKAFNDSTKSLTDFVSSPAWGKLAEQAKRIGDQVASKIARIRDNFGGLASMFARLKDVIVPLGAAIAALGLGQLGGLLGPLAGLVPVISPIAAALAGIVAISPQVQSSIVGIATTIATTLQGAFQRLLPTLNRIFDALASTISRLIDSFGPLLVAIADLVAGVLDGLLPALEPLLELIGQVGMVLLSNLAVAIEAVTPALIEVAEIIGQGLATVITAITPLIVTLAKSVGNILVAAVTALAPLLPPIAEAIIAIVEAFLPLIPILTEVATEISKELVLAIRQLAPFLPPIIKAFADIVKQLAPLSPMLIRLLASVSPLLPPLIKLATTIAVPLIESIVDVIPLIARLAGWIIPPLVAVLNGLFGAIDKVVGVLRTLVGWLGTAIGKVLELGNKIPGLSAILPGSPPPLAVGALAAAEGVRKLAGALDLVDGRTAAFGLKAIPGGGSFPSQRFPTSPAAPPSDSRVVALLEQLVGALGAGRTVVVQIDGRTLFRAVERERAYAERGAA